MFLVSFSSHLSLRLRSPPQYDCSSTSNFTLYPHVFAKPAGTGYHEVRTSCQSDRAPFVDI